jgi:membrane protease YdiL (CAAX protease family)
MQYIAALAAAPVFVLLYISIFGHQASDISQILYEPFSLFFIIVFYPVTEELIFRGMIQEFIAAKMVNYTFFTYISVANILTSVLFVAIHFVYHAPFWALMVFVPSLIFGYFKEQYKHIAPSIFLHIFYNICSLFLLVSLT